MNTGKYDISGGHLPPPCDTTHAAPCIPGDGNLANIPEGNNIGLAPCASYRCPQNYNFGPHIGAAYSLGDKTVIRGGYGLVYDEFAGFLQDMADHVGNWPAAQTVFQSVNSTVGQPLTYIDSLQTLSASPLPTAAPWGTLFWNADPRSRRPYRTNGTSRYSAKQPSSSRCRWAMSVAQPITLIHWRGQSSRSS